MEDVTVIEKDGKLVAVLPNGEVYPRPDSCWMTLGYDDTIDRNGSRGVSLYETFGGQRIEFFSSQEDETLSVYVYNFSSNEWKLFSVLVADEFNNLGIAEEAVYNAKCTLRAFYQITPMTQSIEEQNADELTSNLGTSL
jgi:hypothetical protein